MTAIEREDEAQSGVRVTVDGHGTAMVGTGLPVLDHLLGLLAVHGGFDVQLEIAPGAAVIEAASAGRALGRALAEPLRAGRGHGTAVIPADEALAHVEGRLRRMGVISALEAAGFEPGDDVEIAGVVFELHPG